MDARDYKIQRLNERVTLLEEALLDLAAFLKYFPESELFESYPSRTYWYKCDDTER